MRAENPFQENRRDLKQVWEKVGRTPPGPLVQRDNKGTEPQASRKPRPSRSR